VLHRGAVVLAGTLYPMFADLLLGQKISVGPPFFNTAILPLVVPLVGAMAVGAVMPWKRGAAVPGLARLWWAALGGLAAFLLCLRLDGRPSGRRSASRRALG
jgi:cytochrome c-type biogenesis protein CcmF